MYNSLQKGEMSKARKEKRKQKKKKKKTSKLISQNPHFPQEGLKEKKNMKKKEKKRGRIEKKYCLSVVFHQT